MSRRTKKLYNDLVAGVYMVDFVGIESEGAAEFADPDHQGLSGFTAAQVAINVVGWLNANAADVILLHIGTNDFPSTSTIDVADILDAIDSWDASNNNPVTVLLAQIINRDPFSSLVEDFNQNLASLAQTRNVSGDNIVLVDQHSALDYPPTVPDDLEDSLHPTLTGYGKMADVWFAPLTDAANCFVKN